MSEKPHGAGKSSFDLIDRDKLFAKLDLQRDTVLLDLGCGQGNYTVAAASFIDPGGHIYAFDLWKEGVEFLRQRAVSEKLVHITVAVADAGEKLPLGDQTIDICLLGTVFHDFVHGGTHATALQEVYRALKVGGRLAVVEFIKQDGPPGPPLHIRLSPEELREIITPGGFTEVRTENLGPDTYLAMYTRQNETWRPPKAIR